MSTGSSLPANAFYASPEQRVTLARRRFFEDGVRPSGMISEAVIPVHASFARTRTSASSGIRAGYGQPRAQCLAQQPPIARGRRRRVAEAACDARRHSGTAILADAQGVILDTTFTQSSSHEQLMPITTRVGVNLAEEVVGTTVPGITARTGQPSAVLGSEHFFGTRR